MCAGDRACRNVDAADRFGPWTAARVSCPLASRNRRLPMNLRAYCTPPAETGTTHAHRPRRARSRRAQNPGSSTLTARSLIGIAAAGAGREKGGTKGNGDVVRRRREASDERGGRSAVPRRHTNGRSMADGRQGQLPAYAQRPGVVPERRRAQGRRSSAGIASWARTLMVSPHCASTDAAS